MWDLCFIIKMTGLVDPFLPMRTMRQRFMDRFLDSFLVLSISSIGVSRDVKLKRIQNEIPRAGTIKRRCEGICGDQRRSQERSEGKRSVAEIKL